MHLPYPGRLRPWVRFRTPRGWVEAKPNHSLSLIVWSEMLWDSISGGYCGRIQRNVTACQSISAPLALEKEVCPQSKSALLEMGRYQPAEAALRWGQIHTHSPVPWPRWKRWAALARRRLWPLGLLLELARADSEAELLEPTANFPLWAEELAVTAANWFGAECGARTWNSFCRALTPEAQELRWKLAVVCQLEPPACCDDACLETLLEVLQRCHPANRPHWELLLAADTGDSEELARAWKQPLSADQLEWLVLESEGCSEVIDKAPERLAEFLNFRQEFGSLEQSELAGLFLETQDFRRRALLLTCLVHLQSAAPSAALLRAARATPLGSRVLSAAARWERVDEPSALSVAGLQPEQLARLSHWRSLNGEGQRWPKSLRRWLDRQDQWRSQHDELKRLLKLQQNFEATLRASACRAWRKLLREVTLDLLEDWCGQPLREDQLELGWLLRWPKLTRQHLQLALRGNPDANLDWLARKAPGCLKQEVWRRGLSGRIDWRGRELRAETADFFQALRMGSDFNTCLSLQNGAYAFSALVNALDMNKQVLYLRQPGGQAVLRQLVAVTQGGDLIAYPIYGRKSPELTRLWEELVNDYAGRCGLGRTKDGEVLQLFDTGEYYYTDSIEETALDVRDELDFLQDPTRLSPLSAWSQVRCFLHALHGSGPPVTNRPVIQRLAETGKTCWLHRLARGRLDQRFIEALDYRADPEPLAGYLLRARKPLKRTVRELPVALLGLSFDRLARVLACLRGKGWRDYHMVHQVEILLYVSWLLRPDLPAFWHHLRQSDLAHNLWRLYSLLPESPFDCLLKRAPPGHTVEWRMAASRFCPEDARQALLQNPRRWTCALGLAASGCPSVALAPIPMRSQYEEMAFCEILGNSPSDLTWSVSRFSFQALRQGLQGDRLALKEWAFRGHPGQREWRLKLLARLCRQGDLNLDCLGDWFREEGSTSWAALDQQPEWSYLEDSRVAVALTRSPEKARAYLGQLQVSRRFELMIGLIFQLEPWVWQELCAWHPDPGLLGREQVKRAWLVARNSPRLGAWLEASGLAKNREQVVLLHERGHLKEELAGIHVVENGRQVLADARIQPVGPLAQAEPRVLPADQVDALAGAEEFDGQRHLHAFQDAQ